MIEELAGENEMNEVLKWWWNLMEEGKNEQPKNSPQFKGRSKESKALKCT